MMGLAVFDLDGTLIRVQSQQVALQSLRRMRQISAAQLFALQSWFALYRFGLVRASHGIRLHGYKLLAGLSSQEMDSLATRVCESLQEDFRPKVLAALRSHQNAGDSVLIVSASAHPIVHRISMSLGVEASLGTQLEIRDARYTGRIIGCPLYGQAKADALAKYLANSGVSNSEVVAYGDHHSDIPLLAMANRAVCVCPDRVLRARSRRLGWSVIACE